MTLATVSASTRVLFFWWYAPVQHTGRAYPAPFFMLQKTLYGSSTVAQSDKRFESNTVLWAFHTIEPSSFIIYLSSWVDVRVSAGSRWWRTLSWRSTSTSSQWEQSRQSVLLPAASETLASDAVQRVTSQQPRWPRDQPHTISELVLPLAVLFAWEFVRRPEQHVYDKLWVKNQ